MEEDAMRILPPEILLEEYRQLLADPQVSDLPLVISGGSMRPFLVGGRDTVFLSRVEGLVGRGDMLLYRRDSGEYVLHRVYQVTDGTFTMLGDAHYTLEPGIRLDQVIARVTRVKRKGKLLGPGAFWWEFFASGWLWLRPLRRLIWGCYSAIRH
jgi:hypothetical protein